MLPVQMTAASSLSSKVRKKVMVRGSGAAGARKTLHDMIAQGGAEQVFGHKKFTVPGKAPAKLDVSKSSTFIPNDPKVADMLVH